MTFAQLALICLVAILGPLLSLSRGLRVPVVIGELVVGLALGTTGLRILDPHDPTFAFLADIGFGLVMFVAGTHVPMRDPALRAGARTGLLRALVIGVLSVPVGLGLAHVFGTGQGLLYAVLLTSSSASIVMPANPTGREKCSARAVNAAYNPFSRENLCRALCGTRYAQTAGIPFASSRRTLSSPIFRGRSVPLNGTSRVPCCVWPRFALT